MCAYACVRVCTGIGWLLEKPSTRSMSELVDGVEELTGVAEVNVPLGRSAARRLAGGMTSLERLTAKCTVFLNFKATNIHLDIAGFSPISLENVAGFMLHVETMSIQHFKVMFHWYRAT